jgi:primosomal replication protein N
MTNNEVKRKIVDGSKLAVQRLIARKKKENKELVISQGGKVIKIPASEIK